MVEFHPFALYFDEHWTPHYDYFKGDATEEPAGVGDYVAASGTAGAQHDHPGVVDFANPHPSYEFMWGIGEVVNALVSAAAIDRLTEYPYANGWKGFDGMRAGRPPDGAARSHAAPAADVCDRRASGGRMTRRTAAERDALSARLLTRDDVPLVWTIDRREIIEHLYVLRDGALHLVPDFMTSQAGPTAKPTTTRRSCSTATIAAAGASACSTARGSSRRFVDSQPLGPHGDMLQLKFLHVSHDWRGCGRRAALPHGPRAGARDGRCAPMSATPSQNTIDFYLRLGFTVSTSPDPALYALEPEDIHLEGPTA